MKQSLCAPKAGIPLRGKMKTTTAGDLDEVESNYSNSDQSGLPEFSPAPLLEPVGAATEYLNEASTSVEPVSFIEDIVRSRRSYEDESLTKSSEVVNQPEAQIIEVNCSAMDEGERNLELTLARFSKAMEKLCDAIREVLLLRIEQRKQRNGNDVVLFFLVRVGELTLAFFIGAVLVSVLLANNWEFDGLAPT